VKAERRSDLRGLLLANVREFPETRGARQGAPRASRWSGTRRARCACRAASCSRIRRRGTGRLDLSPELSTAIRATTSCTPKASRGSAGAASVAVLAESGDDDDPPRRLTAQLSEPDFARLVALLEETSFRNSLLDSDDAIQPNAQRDVVFERARLGLADELDERPESEARYDYRGMRERYGMVRGRESLLPIELVVQGDLTDLQLGAFPRLRPPKTTPDAMLYRE
jgi:hypothetical protein